MEDRDLVTSGGGRLDERVSNELRSAYDEDFHDPIIAAREGLPRLIPPSLRVGT
jgi:hypothetical protein